MTRNLILSVAWAALIAVFFRWWDLTDRVPGLALWSCVLLVAFAATVAIVRRRRPSMPLAPERARIIAWAVLIVVTLIANRLVPQVQIASATVRTIAFVKVLDTVIPLWILVRALLVIWQGRARVVAVAGLVPVLVIALWFFVVAMPGRSHRGDLPPLTAAESLVAARLEHDVRRLTGGAGERNHRFPERLEAAAVFLDSTLAASGYRVQSLPYDIAARTYRNLEVSIPGTSRPDDIVVIGAHYDAAEGAPGADDNASGAAAMLAIARAIEGRRFARTVRLVAFTNEEPPFFASDQMGSRVYAALAASRGDRVVAMISIETIGYFSDEAGSQRYPPPFNLIYPDRGNFVGFVGNLASRGLVRRAIGTFRRAGQVPSEGVAAPALIPGIAWSDHDSFWRHGWEAIMISDTAPFRNPHYHQRTDTADRLDYPRMARVVTGLQAVVEDLAN